MQHTAVRFGLLCSPNHSILFLTLSVAAKLPKKQLCLATYPYSCCSQASTVGICNKYLQRLLSTLGFPVISVMPGQALGRGQIFLGRINLLGMLLGTQVGEEIRPTRSHTISPVHSLHMPSSNPIYLVALGYHSSDFRDSKQWVVVFSEAKMRGYFSQKCTSLHLY